MIRILIFIFVLVLVAGAVTALMGLDGWIEGRVFGARYDVHAGFAAVLLLAALILTAAVTGLVKDLRRVPRAVGARQSESRQTAGMKALARGFAAIAAGDAQAAAKAARIAERQIDDQAVTRLLSAQAAQLAGEDDAARAQFQEMLADPHAELVALRGLYLQARQSGALDDAWTHARRAFAARPEAKWAYDAVFSLALERRDWNAAREAAHSAGRRRLIDGDVARRAEAVLFTAEAYAADAQGEKGRALEHAEAALKLEAGFAPAVVLAARRHEAEGRKGKALKLLERAFAADPQPAVAACYLDLTSSELEEKRQDHRERFAALSESSREAVLIRARLRLARGEAQQAARLLEPLLAEAPSRREFALMAEAAALIGGDAEAKPWLLRAASALGEPAPGESGEFRYTPDGWAQLVRHYSEYGRLAPPPLEAAPAGLSFAEPKLLEAPANPPSPPPADAGKPDDAERIVGAAGQVS